jgi:four helix bundle protein
MRNFKQLIFWQRSHALTLKMYAITKSSFPKDEMYGLISQMRRSSSSVPTNIAEGCGRKSNAELKRFLVIATGSISELEYQLLLSKDLLYIKNEIIIY